MSETFDGRLIVGGICGSGKTAVGRRLADMLGAGFVEGDDLHPQANIEKMRGGVPLVDEDRWPWLEKIGLALRSGGPVVASCSALRRAYRDRLRQACDGRVAFVMLEISAEAAERRMAGRQGHFMPAALVESQLATLELPAEGEPDCVVVDAHGSLEEVLRRALGWIEAPR